MMAWTVHAGVKSLLVTTVARVRSRALSRGRIVVARPRSVVFSRDYGKTTERQYPRLRDHIYKFYDPR